MPVEGRADDRGRARGMLFDGPSNLLAQAGGPPDWVHTDATITLREDP
jgi:hypothetical protein